MSQKDYRKFAYHLEALQDTLDRYRRQRNWLVISWLAWILLALSLVVVLFSQVFSISSILLTGITILPLIPLIKQTWRHSQIGAALEDEVRRLPYRQLAGEFDSEKPKKHQAASDSEVIEDTPYFTLGDDGELIEISEDENYLARQTTRKR